MRFHLTLAFSQLLSQRAAAEEQANAVSPDDPQAEALSKAEYDLIEKLMLHTPALTPTEVAAKIELYATRDMNLWQGGEAYLAAIQGDLASMQGWPVSPPMLEAWAAWREHDERFTLADTDDENDALLPERNALYRQLHETPCTTPGDFIVKQYARLHGVLGSTLYGAAKEDMTGNPHDVDIDNGSTEGGLFEEIEYPALYADIDATDVGANLLAYGLPYFDAEKWMERADAIGLRVDLVEQPGGGWAFHQHMDLQDDENRGNNPRIRREQDRLRRILAFPGMGPDWSPRIRAVADEIRREWPQLIVLQPVPAE